jgi:hypothetical protein
VQQDLQAAKAQSVPQDLQALKETLVQQVVKVSKAIKVFKAMLVQQEQQAIQLQVQLVQQVLLLL